MPLVDLDDPEELCARWSALAAIAHATGYDRAWWADDDGWHYQDGAGNDLRLVELDQDRAVLFGLHREYSRTTGSDLLEGAPDWIAQPPVRERIGRGELGFVYANFSGTWARAAYPGDPWQPVDDGFLAVASWLTSDEETAAELVEWAAEWADYLGSLDDLRTVGLELVRDAGRSGIRYDDLLELFDRLGAGPYSMRRPDARSALAAAARFGGPTAVEQARPSGGSEPRWRARLGLVPSTPPGEPVAPVEPVAEPPVDVVPRVAGEVSEGDDFYASLFADAPAAASYVPDVPDQEDAGPGDTPAEPVWVVDEATREFFPLVFEDDGDPAAAYRSEPVVDQSEPALEDYGGDPLGSQWSRNDEPEAQPEEPASDVVAPHDVAPHDVALDDLAPDEARQDESAEVESDEAAIDAEPEPAPDAEPEPGPGAEPEPEPAAGYEFEPERGEEPAPEPAAGFEFEADFELSADAAEESALGFGAPPAPAGPRPIDRPPPPDDDEGDDDFDLESLANLPPPGAADRRYSRFEREHGLADCPPVPVVAADLDETAARLPEPLEADSGTAEPPESQDAGVAEVEIPEAATPVAAFAQRYIADDLNDDDPVDVPAGPLEAAMRAERERPRPRPEQSAAFEALHEWCRARTRIVPSGFTIQVQVLDPAAPTYRFDLEPPQVDDPAFGADLLAGLLADLWASEAGSAEGGWLFARIDAAGRTLRIDRWYDQIPEWWDDPLVERIDVRGLRRQLSGRAADRQPTYLEKLSTGAR